jgi:PAS domain-containing protein
VAQAAEGSVNQLVGESKADEPDDALDPFVVAVECTRMPMVFMDAMKSGNPIIFANDSFIALFRCARSEILGLDFQALMERGTDPDAQSQVKAAFENTSDKDPEISYRRNDGSQFWASIFITPVSRQTTPTRSNAGRTKKAASDAAARRRVGPFLA